VTTRGRTALTSPPSHAFPRALRVRKRADFLRIQRSGVRVGTRHMLLLLTPRAGDPDGVAPPRLGVVASRKVGGAVERNRTKRLLREAFRRNRRLFAAGTDCVILARPGLDALTLADVEAELLDVAHLLRRRAAEARAGACRGPGGDDVGADRRSRGARP
jgi:ribonuclease P protein component